MTKHEFNRAYLEIEDGVGKLVMNHTEVMNAVSGEMLEGLVAALNFIEKPGSGVRCVCGA